MTAHRPRNWIAYLCENLASSGMMPTWEAATYLTDNLFGDKPNPRLLRTASPYEDTTPCFIACISRSSRQPRVTSRSPLRP